MAAEIGRRCTEHFGTSVRRHPYYRQLAKLLVAFVDANDLGDRLDAWTDLVRWTRRAGKSGRDAERLEGLVGFLEADPVARTELQGAVAGLLARTDALGLFADAGMPGHRGFVAELMDRLMIKVLPARRADPELAALFARQFVTRADVATLATTPTVLFDRLCVVLYGTEDDPAWQRVRYAFADGMRLLAGRIRNEGLGDKIRARSPTSRVTDSPFFTVAALVDEIASAWSEGRDVTALVARLPDERTRCEALIAYVLKNLEREGVSVDIVYGLLIVQSCLERLTLMTAVVAATTTSERAAAIHVLLVRLAASSGEQRSVRRLIETNLRLLQRRIVERSGETGEHYIAHNRNEYKKIWLAGAGGGLLTVFTAAIKLRVHDMHFPLFIEGALASTNYAVSFIFLQLFGFMLATKQPAMTASHLATILRDRRGEDRLDGIVEMTMRITSSQLAAAFANVFTVSVAAFCFDKLFMSTTGESYVAPDHAEGLLRGLSVAHSLTPIYAAVTGVLLFLGSLAGGWFDNWAVYHDLPSAIAEHRIGRWVGRERTRRLAGAFSRNFGGIATNVALGTLLGMTPAMASFFGLPLDVRHVTLSSGVLALSASSLGASVFHTSTVFFASFGIVAMFVLNLSVSFALALYTGVQAHGVSRADLLGLARRFVARLVRAPFDFVRPPPDSPPLHPPVRASEEQF